MPDLSELMAFAMRIAELKLYESEMEPDGEDAMQCLNQLIEEARRLTA